MYKIQRNSKNNAIEKAKLKYGWFSATIVNVLPAEGFVDDSVIDVYYNVDVNGKVVEKKERFALNIPSERNDRFADALDDLGCENVEEAVGKRLMLHFAYEFTRRGKYLNIVEYKAPMEGGVQND